MLSMRDLLPWRPEKAPARRTGADLHPLEGLHREIDRLFEDMGWGFTRPLFGEMDRWTGLPMPKVEVHEDDKAFRVSAELPGMDENDVEVILRDDRLTIKGEKKEEKTEEKREGYSYSERTYGRFERSFPVGPDVKAEEIAAEFRKGVLTVTLPKTEEARKTYRKIEIHGAKPH